MISRNATSEILGNSEFQLVSLGFSDVKKRGVTNRADSFKKQPTKRPDWNELMKEIEVYRYGHSGLKKVQTNDRSMPILPKLKRGGEVRSSHYESFIINRPTL